MQGVGGKVARLVDQTSKSLTSLSVVGGIRRVGSGLVSTKTDNALDVLDAVGGDGGSLVEEGLLANGTVRGVSDLVAEGLGVGHCGAVQAVSYELFLQSLFLPSGAPFPFPLGRCVIGFLHGDCRGAEVEASSLLVIEGVGSADGATGELQEERMAAPPSLASSLQSRSGGRQR